MTRKTEQVVPADAELLRDMSQSQSHRPDVDPDIAMLLRLADDPLLLSAFVQRRSAGSIDTRQHREEAAAGVALPLQRFAVPIREAQSRTPISRYALVESRTGTSCFPFAFIPDIMDRDMSLRGEDASSSDRPSFKDVHHRRWRGLMLLALGLFVLVLFLSFY